MAFLLERQALSVTVEMWNITLTKGRIMFSHIMLGSNDLEASKKFYDAILGTLGYEPGLLEAIAVFMRHQRVCLF